jgi:hypothetical protein
VGWGGVFGSREGAGKKGGEGVIGASGGRWRWGDVKARVGDVCTVDVGEGHEAGAGGDAGDYREGFQGVNGLHCVWECARVCAHVMGCIASQRRPGCMSGA